MTGASIVAVANSRRSSENIIPMLLLGRQEHRLECFRQAGYTIQRGAAGVQFTAQPEGGGQRSYMTCI
ncbi:hypothetical protein BK126_02765 [Paenibacillus sp. FSL H7-0326]|nr:hypothetical protein BK126_02765 [Paenibacillus sp. FSL H7-0326]